MPDAKKKTRRRTAGGGDPKPHYTKKMGSKISNLSSKVTEVRCTLTNLQSATLYLARVLL